MKTITKPVIEIETSTLEAVEEKGIIIVHCNVTVGMRARIWRSTYLVDTATGFRSKMLHADNIPLYPVSKRFTIADHHFTLFFEPLPKSCKSFTLHEIIPEPGGFIVPDIARNQEDVYRINVY